MRSWLLLSVFRILARAQLLPRGPVVPPDHFPGISFHTPPPNTTTTTSSDPVLGRQQCRQHVLLRHGETGARSVLQAVCPDDDGGGAWWLTSLDLSRCLGSDDGRLTFEPSGHFDRVCRPCVIDDDGGLVIKCACRPDDEDGHGEGEARYTQLSLSAHDHLGIHAVEGRLVCGHHRGTKSPHFQRRSKHSTPRARA